MNNTSLPANECAAGNAEIFLMSVVLSILSVFTSLFHALFLIAIARTPRLRTLANKILAALALIDIGQGVTTIPIEAVRLHQKFRNCNEDLRWSSATKCTGFSLAVMSIMTIFVVALEQYFAILYPYQHGNYMSARRVFTPLVASWVVFTTYNILSVFFEPRLWRGYEITVTVLVVTLLVVMVYMYTHIYRQVQKTRRQISITNLAEGERIKRRAKAAKTSCLILVTFVLCYSPYTISSIYVNCCLGGNRVVLTEWVYVIALSSALWDSIIYYWRLKSVRKATWNMLHLHNKLAIEEARRGIRCDTHTSAITSVLNAAFTISEGLHAECNVKEEGRQQESNNCVPDSCSHGDQPQS